MFALQLQQLSNERKQTFRKNYLANWSKAIYSVKSISKGSAWQHPQFKLMNEHGPTIQQRFYRSDLQAIDTATLAINTLKRPDYSKGSIFNQEEQAKKMAKEGQVANIVLPKSTQGQDRLQGGGRQINAPRRLIDEILQKEANQSKGKMEKKKVASIGEQEFE